MPERIATTWRWLLLAVVAAWCVGMFGRAYWTPDEPREADLAWRMTWQQEKSVPLLAGEAFCEKPPLLYWLAAPAIEAFGTAAWAARLPNLLYAIFTALAVFALARRAAGEVAAWVAAAAISTFLLAYQVTIWLATDAPLLATVAIALLGAYRGFHAEDRGSRLRGYTIMHAALALGFLAKSGAAWMVPVLTLATLMLRERRLNELLRWELYAGLVLQAVVVGAWIAAVYLGTDGSAHLRVFLWDNLAGRFTKVSGPGDVQYTNGHHNTPGKYLLELPEYLWPWTLLLLAAIRRGFRRRRDPPANRRAVRFAAACVLPTMALLSLAATARNVYLAPALPGAALLLGWWASEAAVAPDAWDLRALRATALLLLLGAALVGLAAALIGYDAWPTLASRSTYVFVCALGVGAAAVFALRAWRSAGRGALLPGLAALLAAYCALLTLPATQIYPQVDRWHDFAALGRSLRADLAGAPLVLISPDETTRAWVDLYADHAVRLADAPGDRRSLAALRRSAEGDPRRRFLVMLGGRAISPRLRALAARMHLKIRQADDPPEAPTWAAAADLRIERIYALPYGRRYALLAPSATRRNSASY